MVKEAQKHNLAFDLVLKLRWVKNMEQQRIEVVGKLGSTYGIRGLLRIYSSTEQAESIFDYQPCF